MGKLIDLQKELYQCHETINEIIKEMEKESYGTCDLIMAKKHIVKAVERIKRAGFEYPDLR